MNEDHQGESIAVSTEHLSKQYGRVVALSDATIEVPAGRVSALVGPNGAGKTTLLTLLAGLSRPSAGGLWVHGRTPRQSPEFLSEIGFLAQEMPLWHRLSAADHLEIGAHMNLRWDGAAALERLRAKAIPTDRPIATLSGGQRAQVALTLALAKRPRLLLLDEPVAALDPLARRQFLATLVDAVASEPLTVLLSSHLVSDLERVCDHLVLLARSHVQLCADIDQVLAEHKVLMGPRRDRPAFPPHQVIDATHTPRQTTLLIRTTQPVLDPGWEVGEPDLEEIVLAYMARSEPGDQPALQAVAGDSR